MFQTFETNLVATLVRYEGFETKNQELSENQAIDSRGMGWEHLSAGMPTRQW